jgi:hypothetical protein
MRVRRPRVLRVLSGRVTQTLTAIDNSTYGPTGLPVISTVITIAEQGSMIAQDGGAAGVG